MGKKKQPTTISVFDQAGVHNYTPEEYRASSASDQMYRSDIGGLGLVDPDLMFGAAKGRTVSADEKKYRSNYKSITKGLEGVTASDALKAVALFATVAFGGGALASLRAGSGAALAAPGVGSAAPGVGSVATPGAAAVPAAAVPGAAAEAALPEIVVSGTAGGISPGAIGSGIGAAGAGFGPSGSSFAETPPSENLPDFQTKPTKGLLGQAWDFIKSETGMNLIGGALQGYSNDQAQRRNIKEQRRYSRPFTSQEIEGITRGMDVAVPSGFLENARRVGEFLNGPARPSVGAGSMTPEQVAALARGG